MKCPKCESENVTYSWKVGQRDKFWCHNCGAKWIDGQEEKIR